MGKKIDETVRLNSAIRNHITQQAEEMRFGVATMHLAELQDRHDKLTMEVNDLAFAECIPEHHRKLLEKIPDNWLRTSSYDPCVHFAIDESDNVTSHSFWLPTKIAHEFSETKAALPVYSKIPHALGQRVHTILDSGKSEFLKKRDELSRLDQELSNTSAKLKDEKTAFSRRIEAILKNSTTVRSLLARWPEAKELLPEENTGEGGLAPMEMIRDINRELGLSS